MKAIALAAALALSGGAASAATISTGPIDATQIANYMGHEWAWALPCDAVQPSCGNFDIAEQATYGWRLPTAAEIAAYIAPDIDAFVDAFIRADGNLRCASAWFNAAYSHCDQGDARDGIIHGLNFDSYTAFYNETFVVRGDMIAPVPLPASALLLGAGLAGLGGLSRRRKAV